MWNIDRSSARGLNRRAKQTLKYFSGCQFSTGREILPVSQNKVVTHSSSLLFYYALLLQQRRANYFWFYYARVTVDGERSCCVLASQQFAAHSAPPTMMNHITSYREGTILGVPTTSWLSTDLPDVTSTHNIFHLIFISATTSLKSAAINTFVNKINNNKQQPYQQQQHSLCAYFPLKCVV